MTFGVESYTTKIQDFIFCAHCGRELNPGEDVAMYYCKHKKCFSAVYYCDECYNKPNSKSKLHNLHDAVREYVELVENNVFIANGELQKYVKPKKESE